MIFFVRPSRLAGLVLILAAGTEAQAQIFTGNLTLTVHASNGQPLRDATVRLVSERMQGERAGVTDASGAFRAPLLPPGLYTLTVSRPLFRTRTLTATVNLGATTPAELTLEPEVAAEATVMVVASASSSRMDPARVVPPENFKGEAILNRFPVGRTPTEIGQLAPGSVEKGGYGSPSFSGAASSENKYMVNGVDINDPYFNSPNDLFIEDTIEETVVIQNSVSAEYGRFTGAVINAITKSGGNEWSGTWRSTLTNPTWDAVLPDQSRDGIRSSLNMVHTATMGGPLIKDKLWYFVAARGARTAAPDVLPITSYPYSWTQNKFRYEGKLTWAVNDTNTFVGSTIQGRTATRNTPLKYNSITADGLSDQYEDEGLYVMEWRSIIGETMTLELRGAAKRQTFRTPGEGTGRAFRNSPTWDSLEDAYLNNRYFGLTPEQRNNQELAAVFTWLVEGAGTHELKFGLAHFQESNRTDNAQSITGYTITPSAVSLSGPSPAYQFFSVADFEDWNTQPASMTEYTSLMTKFTSTYKALFVNDSWKVTPRLTLGLGGRLETFSAASSTPATLPPRASSWQPRLSANYSLNEQGSSQVGASYAVYAGKMNASFLMRGSAADQPPAYSYLYIGPPVAAFTPNNGTNPGFNRDNYAQTPYEGFQPVSSVRFQKKVRAPSVVEATLSYRRALDTTGTFTLSLVDREYRDMYESNIGDAGTYTDPRIEEGFQNTFYVKEWGNATRDQGQRRYRAMVLGLEQQWGRLRVNSNYTYARLTGNFNSDVVDDPASGSASLAYTRAIANRAVVQPSGNLDDDIRHQLHVLGDYQWSWPKQDLVVGLHANYTSGRPYSKTALAPYLGNNPDGSNSLYPLAVLDSYVIYPEGLGTHRTPNVWKVDVSMHYDLALSTKLHFYTKLTVNNFLNKITEIALPAGQTGSDQLDYTYLGSRTVQVDVGFKF